MPLDSIKVPSARPESDDKRTWPYRPATSFFDPKRTFTNGSLAALREFEALTAWATWACPVRRICQFGGRHHREGLLKAVHPDTGRQWATGPSAFFQASRPPLM